MRNLESQVPDLRIQQLVDNFGKARDDYEDSGVEEEFSHEFGANDLINFPA